MPKRELRPPLAFHGVVESAFLDQTRGPMTDPDAWAMLPASHCTNFRHGKALPRFNMVLASCAVCSLLTRTIRISCSGFCRPELEAEDERLRVRE
eukprot:8928223-Pyramimonas_sp.AAC.1